MAVAFVQSHTGNGTTDNVGTITVTVSGASANNMLVGVISVRGGTSISGFAATGWTLIHDNGEASGDASGAVFWRLASGDANDNFTPTWTGVGNCSAIVDEYSGLATTGNPESSNENATYSGTNQTADSPINTNSATPTTANGMAVAAFCGNDERDYNETELYCDGYTDSGYYNPGSGGYSVAGLAYKSYSSAVAQSGDWYAKAGSAFEGYAVIAVFKEPAGAGGSTGTATGILSAITGSASGATTVPAFSGTAAGVLSVISGNATGAVTAPGSTATAAGVLSQISGSATGATIPPVFSATASGQLTAIIGTADGLVDNPGFSATASGTLSAVTGSASGQVVNAGIVGTGAGVLSQITGNATGNATAPEFNATGAGVLQNITGSASGEFLDTAVTGSGAGILAQIFGSASATFFTDDSTGTGTGILSQIFGSATGIIVNPDTGENINLQIVWIDNKKELEFLEHTRSMELYD